MLLGKRVKMRTAYLIVLILIIIGLTIMLPFIITGRVSINASKNIHIMSFEKELQNILYLKHTKYCDNQYIKILSLIGQGKRDRAARLAKTYFTMCFTRKQCVAFNVSDFSKFGIDTENIKTGQELCSQLNLQCTFMTNKQTQEIYNSVNGECDGSVQMISIDNSIENCFQEVSLDSDDCVFNTGNPILWTSITEPFYGDLRHKTGVSEIYCCKF